MPDDMYGHAPTIHRDDSPLVTVDGIFFRAVDPDYVDAALSGSRSEGRYSPTGVATLYLSSSPEGVAAAMIKHATNRVSNLELLSFEVSARRIADLRDRQAMALIGVDSESAFGDWQHEIRSGITPQSWQVRAQLEDAGAHGLIDPSRKQPGEWHLTLFTWNTPDAPRVRVSSRAVRRLSGPPDSVD